MGHSHADTDTDPLASKVTDVLRRASRGNVTTPRPRAPVQVPPPPDEGPCPTDTAPPREHGPSAQRRALEAQILTYYGPDALAYVDKPSLLPSTGKPEYVLPGICMSDIARDTGMSLGAVSRIFNGMRKGRAATIKAIALLYCDGDIAKVREVIRKRALHRLKVTNLDDPDRAKRIAVLQAYGWL